MDDIDRFRSELLDRDDGSCRDINFAGMTWDDALTVLRRVFVLADSGTVTNGQGTELSFDADAFYESSRSTSHARAYFASSTAPFTHFQCSLCDDNDGPFMELSFFPDDIVLTDDPLCEIVRLINNLCDGTAITNFFVRYENASWMFGDNGPTSGVIFTKSSVGQVDYE